jgi:hypothetical protein
MIKRVVLDSPGTQRAQTCIPSAQATPAPNMIMLKIDAASHRLKFFDLNLNKTNASAVGKNALVAI